MKTVFTLLVVPLFIIMLSFSCNSPKNELKLDWIIDANVGEDGYYTNAIRIVNTGDVPLDQVGWTIYSNFIPRKYVFDAESPLNVEVVDGTFYKIEPTQFFKTLNPADTLIVSYKTKSAVPNLSYLLDGAYLVFDDATTKPSPMDLKTEIIRNDNEFRPQGFYASGQVLFEDNKLYSQQFELGQADIIPSVKKQKEDVALSLQLTKDMQIVAADDFKNEKEILMQQLSQMGYSVVEKGGTIINMIADNTIQQDGGYNLNVNTEGITIAASKADGMFYGTQTLVSILLEQQVPAVLCDMTIQDYPDLKYRGVMLDVTRNFTTKENLLNLIDILSFYKLNYLHLHLSDDEAWRLEIPGIEELTTIASRRGHNITGKEDFLVPAYNSGWNPNDLTKSGNGYYSKDDFVDILQHAAKRHITIIPEIDLPGHSKAAIYAMSRRYDKYKDTDSIKANEYLLMDPADNGNYLSIQNYSKNVVNPVMPSTYRFVGKVLQEIQNTYNEAGVELEFIHIGGDEVPSKAWDNSPLCQEFMKANDMEKGRDLKDHFVRQVLKIAENNNLRLGGWQELVMKPNEVEIDTELKKHNTVSYLWNTLPSRGLDEIPYKLANEGFNVVICNAPNLYLDFAYDNHFYERGLNWGGFVDERSSFDLQPYNIYNSIRRNIKGERINNLEELNATANKNKTSLKNKENLLGIQGQLFSETIRNYDDVTYYLLPKMLGLVERGWNVDMFKNGNHDVANYEKAINLFNDKLSKNELLKIGKMGVKYRIVPPGVTVENGQLLANSRLKGARIFYTLDGSEPTINSLEWVAPVACDADVVKAKAFYDGKGSVTSIYYK